MATSTSERGNRGVSRVLTKLHCSIESGNFYEAHQMYRTLYFRYNGQQKYDECLELLYDGALKLLFNQQETSGADLGILLLDTLDKRSKINNEKKFSTDEIDVWMQRLGIIISQISASTVERETLITRSIKWSSEVSQNNLGHPTMHKLIAQALFSEGSIEQARLHYILCGDGVLCGRIIIKISESKGFDSEIDLFIAQAVLQQLCLKDKNTAEKTFVTCTIYHPQIHRKGPPFKMPLLNFIFFLLRTIDVGRLEMYKSLCDLYKPSLNRDPSYEKYLEKIGVLFFGATQPPRQQRPGMMGGIFGELFSRIMNGFDDDDEADVNQGQHNAHGDSETNELD